MYISSGRMLLEMRIVSGAIDVILRPRATAGLGGRFWAKAVSESPSSL